MTNRAGMPPLVLASASPRRVELLRQLGDGIGLTNDGDAGESFRANFRRGLDGARVAAFRQDDMLRLRLGAFPDEFSGFFHGFPWGG